jgi:hypothetical protein
VFSIGAGPLTELLVAPRKLAVFGPIGHSGMISCGGLNQSFETGALAPEWTLTDLATPFFPASVVGPGISPGFGLFTSAPTEGAFAALHGWDGGTGTILIEQDFVIPAGTTTLSFDYRAGWELSVFGATIDRLFEVEVQPAGGGAALQTDLILTATAGTFVGDTGNLLGSVDISSFAGTTRRIVFRWTVPEDFTGPAFFQLDNLCGASPIVFTATIPLDVGFCGLPWAAQGVVTGGFIDLSNGVMGNVGF